MCRSFSRLIGFATLLLAVAVVFVVAGPSVAYAHPGHGHADPDRSRTQSTRAVQVALMAHDRAVSIPRNTAGSETGSDRKSHAASVRSSSYGRVSVGGLARDGGTASDAGCAFPGCCSSGPCSACCSVLPSSPVFVWPSSEAARFGVVPDPALRDDVSSGLKRPPRSFA